MEVRVQQRLFTVDEANALIPKLDIVMGQLQRHGSALREQLQPLADQGGNAVQRLSTEQILELRPDLRLLLAEIEALLGELESLGVQMKGFDLGLIDFPAEVDGEIVLLCWQYGETEVAYYHTMEAGFAGRKPLHPNVERSRMLQ